MHLIHSIKKAPLIVEKDNHKPWELNYIAIFQRILLKRNLAKWRGLGVKAANPIVLVETVSW